HPSTARPLQSANGAVQAAIVHIPAAHPGVPLAAAQILPHVPQSLTFFCVSTHPSGPQNVLPLMQAGSPQSPPLQAPLAQSPSPAHILLFTHFGQEGPPQSMSVSVPFLIPSEQVGTPTQ